MKIFHNLNFAFLVIFSILSVKSIEGSFSRIRTISEASKSITTDAESDYRLPNNTKPVSYDIFLETKVHEKDFTFKGEVKIILKVGTNIKDNKNIVIHARQLEIEEVTLRLEAPGSVDIPVTNSYEKEREFLTITLSNKDDVLKENTNYELNIKYTGTLREDNGGFYRSSYKNSKGNDVFIATTQFESTDARHGFPCYDEPGIKAQFTVTIKHGKSFSAISNTEVDTKGKPDKDGMVTTIFKSTAIMSTYLVAFIVSDFEYTENKKYHQRVYSHPGTKDYQKFALQSGVDILNNFNEYFHIPYAFPKMDQAAIPDFAAGAMENWGLVTYREEALLYNEKTGDSSAQMSIAKIIAHEFTHQWFGNLVSPKWWTYTWLNEGFATLYSYLGVELTYPEWDVMQTFITGDLQRALRDDVDSTARPMTHYVQKPKEIQSIFDHISYSKAGSVLRMILHVMGESNFKQGLVFYLKEMRYDAAKEEDLFAGLEKSVKLAGIKLPGTVQEIMQSWTLQKGYPILTVERNYDDGTFTITQERFSKEYKKIDDVKLQKNLWYVPYNFVTGNNANFDHTTTDGFLNAVKSIRIQQTSSRKWSKDDWLILNKQQTGYYRVNYDEKNWNLLISALKNKPEKIHVFNRAQLIDDAYQFVVSKKLPLGILIDLLTYLSGEENYAPWTTAGTPLSTFNKLLNGDEKYKKFLHLIVEKPFKNLGTTVQDDDTQLKKVTRRTVLNWACIAGVEECLKTTKDLLEELINNNKEIDVNMKSVIYCNGLRDASEKVFNYFYDKFTKTTDQTERKVLNSALGCMNSADYLKKFISSSINEKISLRPTERIVILSAVYTNGGTGLLTCIDFLLNNYKKYSELTPGFAKGNPLSDDIIRMADMVVNTEQETKINELVEKVKDVQGLDKDLKDKVDKKVKANLDWVAEYRDSLITEIEKHTKNSSVSIKNSLVMLLIALFTSIYCFN